MLDQSLRRPRRICRPIPCVHATFAAIMNTKPCARSAVGRYRLLTGKVHALIKDRHRSREFIEFLKLLDCALSPTPLKLILTIFRTLSRSTTACLHSPACRFEFIVKPNARSWLNLIEGFVSKFARFVPAPYPCGFKV